MTPKGHSCLVPLAVAFAVVSCSSDVTLHGAVIRDPLPAAPLVVTMSSGRPYELKSDTGKLVLLYFGYTRCPDLCPMMLSDWARAKGALGPAADGMRFVFVSVDSEGDTPQGTELYARQFDPSFIGLAPGAAELQVIMQVWGIVAFREEWSSPGKYGMAHPANSFLVDRKGRVLAMYAPETKWQDLVDDLRNLR